VQEDTVKIGLAFVLAALVWTGAAPMAARQAPSAAASAKIQDCVQYEAMVTACLPKMCEQERALAELELSFHRETLAKVVELKGRQAGAQVCAQSLREAAAGDVYGCYATEAGAQKHPIRLDQVRPTDTGVALTLTSLGIAPDETARVVIAASIMESPTAVYALPRDKGTFVVDTSSAVAGGGQAIRLEPRTTYCFAIESTTGTARKVYRQGVFTTLPKR
jgi:hypothetical protein